jgi:Arc/MetJ family transcription regulator
MEPGTLPHFSSKIGPGFSPRLIHMHYCIIHIGGSEMRTNIVIDDRLMDEAMRRAGMRTKRAAVEAGLRLLIQVKSQSRIRRLRGKVHWAGDLNEMRADRIQEL